MLTYTHICLCILFLDIDECFEGTDTCRADEQCKDLSAQDGKFECVMRCPPGLDQTADGLCVGQWTIYIYTEWFVSK